MSLLNKVLIFSEKNKSYNELVMGAQSIADNVSAIVIGSKEEANEIADYGAKACWLGERKKEVMVEDYTPIIAEIIQKEKPNLVLLRDTRRGKLIAGRLGIQLNAGVVTDVTAIENESDKSCMLQKLVYGGSAIRTERIISEIAIATISSGVLNVGEQIATGEVIEYQQFTLNSEINVKEVKPKEEVSVDLDVAKRVIGIGRGLTSQEDLVMVKEFADQIGAEVGCSRPIAEEEKWMDRGSYMGVSGAMIKPDIYFAVGISGQVQHMVGVNGARIIVAINKDKNAPIFNYADYGIVGDLYKILPELTKQARQ